MASSGRRRIQRLPVTLVDNGQLIHSDADVHNGCGHTWISRLSDLLASSEQGYLATFC